MELFKVSYNQEGHKCCRRFFSYWNREFVFNRFIVSYFYVKAKNVHSQGVARNEQSVHLYVTCVELVMSHNIWLESDLNILSVYVQQFESTKYLNFD
jgi:hypothetical protein